MSLIPGPDSNLYLPPDWDSTAPVLIPGVGESGSVGWATLALTPDYLVLAMAHSVLEAVPLWSIDAVSVVKFEGLIITHETSAGLLQTALPYPHGLQVDYSEETRLRQRLHLITLAANAAHAWRMEITLAAREAQRAIIRQMVPRKRPRSAR